MKKGKKKGKWRALHIDEETARKCAQALTAPGYDYAGGILTRMFVGLSRSEVADVFAHLGRFIEKIYGGDWPEPPPEVNDG